MMKKEELNIGNIVSIKTYKGLMVKITKIVGNKVFLDYAGNKDGEIVAETKDLNPIKITETFLIRNGFDVKEEEFKNEVYYERELKGFNIIGRKDVVNLSETDWYFHIDNCDMNSVGGGDINYIHQLQNMILLFTGYPFPNIEVQSTKTLSLFEEICNEMDTKMDTEEEYGKEDSETCNVEIEKMMEIAENVVKQLPKSVNPRIGGSLALCHYGIAKKANDIDIMVDSINDISLPYPKQRLRHYSRLNPGVRYSVEGVNVEIHESLMPYSGQELWETIPNILHARKILKRFLEICYNETGCKWKAERGYLKDNETMENKLNYETL